MSDLGAEETSPTPRPSVFLSYASEDRPAARLIRDALPALGLEVWYDESELGGGEAWDQKIRRQIRDCDYFMPLVSAQTQARTEGYFRREWRLAVERTLDMVDDHLFLLPVVIDNTDQATARVPEKFLTVQWLRVPGGQPTPGLEALCRRIVAGDSQTASAARKVASPRATKAGSVPASSTSPPEFPREEPGKRLKFGVDVTGWALRAGWFQFNRLPRWVRIVAYIWVSVAMLSRLDSSNHDDSAAISPEKVAKVKAISEKYQGNMSRSDIVKLGTDIAKEIADDSEPAPTDQSPLLAIPFTAPAGDAAAAKLADSTFAMAYGMAAMSHQGQVGLTKDPLASQDLGAAVERGRANHSTYVLRGSVDAVGAAPALIVQIARVADGSVVWSKAYPAVGADPATIAAEVDSKIPALSGP